MRRAAFFRCQKGTWRSEDGTGNGFRRTMGADRAHSSAAEAAAVPVHWTQADRKSSGADGDRFRPPHGDSLGGPAQGDGLRMRDDVLEAIARLASGRGVGRHPPCLAQPFARSGPTRLVPHGGGQFQCACCFWGRRQGRTLPIEAKAARSTTSSSTATGRRWPSPSAVPMPQTSRN